MRALNDLKQDKGVAGLTILLSVVVLLFIIGLLVMVFSLMGGELEDYAEIDQSDDAFTANTTYNNITSKAYANSTIRALEDVACTIYNLTNASDGTLIGATNYTVVGTETCYLIQTSASDANGETNNSGWNVTFAYTYTTDTIASGVIENSTQALVTVSEWFPLFIVITAMVVLVLLTVIIITVIRGSGLIASGGSGRARGVGGSA